MTSDALMMEVFPPPSPFFTPGIGKNTADRKAGGQVDNFRDFRIDVVSQGYTVEILIFNNTFLSKVTCNDSKFCVFASSVY